ncbi:hypothetical protein HDE74_004485 [Janthinobacterium sp. K2Li3]|nr:hypothetical protein [Janthinobacterium sp. K2C7]MBB5383710.1 hypothetical protein [Janthinobacterium sp. K2Li3]MBB5388215.1 hypothetical protein [Janthinobacterium sp. K2E3]
MPGKLEIAYFSIVKLCSDSMMTRKKTHIRWQSIHDANVLHYAEQHKYACQAFQFGVIVN